MKYSEVIYANKEFDERVRGQGSSAVRPRVMHKAASGWSGRSAGFDMKDALYAKSGAPIGFHDGKIIYDLQGQPVGQLRGSQAYCMGGHFVGELNNGVILKKSINRGSIPASNNAGSGARGNPGVRNHRSRRTGKKTRQ